MTWQNVAFTTVVSILCKPHKPLTTDAQSETLMMKVSIYLVYFIHEQPQ